MKKTIASIGIVILTFVLVASASLADHLPRVTKVEPPNWWPGHTWNPVRLLVRGENLTGAVLESSANGLAIDNVKTNQAGTYLFADVAIGSNAQPGSYPLNLRTPNGKAPVLFELHTPLLREGRFQGFSPDDVFYLLMPDRFANGDPGNDDPEISRGLFDRSRSRYYHGGDLQGAIDRLPYLKELGVTVLWMNPVYDNVNHLNERETYNNRAITDYHGYGAVDFYGVEEHFGSLELFRELVDRAHALGIKIVQDQVANHTGPYHPWVTDSPTPTWYNGTEADHRANVWQTWTLTDPHASPELQRDTLEGWFIDILPDLNQNDPETARYLIQNTLWWIGVSGMDGIRQDTLPYVPRRFWRDWTAAIQKEYPTFSVVGEMWDGNAAKVSFFQGGRARFDGVDSGIDALFDFPLFYPLRRAFAEGQSIRQVAEAIALDYLYENSDRLITFAGLHDVPRFMNEPNADFTGLKLAYTFLMTARGIPLIYYGDEIGLPGGGDPDNRCDFPGGWPDDTRNAFTEEGRTPPERDLFDHLCRLTALRRELEPLRRGKMIQLCVDEWTYAYARVKDRAWAIVAFNNGASEAALKIPLSVLALPNGYALRDRLGVVSDARIENGLLSLTLPSRSAAILAAME